MCFHFSTKTWKWSYGRYTHSGTRVLRKVRENVKFEKRPLYRKNDSSDYKNTFPTKGQRINEFHFWHMCFKWYTRYKSNPIYQIGQINGNKRNPVIIGNSGFAYFRILFVNWSEDEESSEAPRRGLGGAAREEAWGWEGARRRASNIHIYIYIYIYVCIYMTGWN